MSKAVSIEGPAVNTVATAKTPATTEARNTAVANIFVAVPSIERSTALLRPLHLCSFPQPVTSKSNTVGAPLNCRAFKCGAPLECGKKLPSQFPSLGYGCRTHVGPAPLKYAHHSKVGRAPPHHYVQNGNSTSTRDSMRSRARVRAQRAGVFASPLY